MSKFIDLVNNSGTRSNNKKAMTDKVVERCNFLVSRIKELDKLEWSQYVDKIKLIEYLTLIEGFHIWENRYDENQQVVCIYFNDDHIICLHINYEDDRFKLSLGNLGKTYTGDWPYIYKILSELKIVHIKGTDAVYYTYDD